MKKVLLDTNGYSALAGGDEATLSAVAGADVVYMSAIVLGELLAGFKGGTREAENNRVLRRFIEKPTVKTLSVTPDTAEVYSTVKSGLRKAGTPIPINDVWIAAQALEAGAIVISDDAHFSRVPGLRLWDRSNG